MAHFLFIFYFRVLEKVNFEKRFEALPQFNPERTDTDSPLPQSPRGIIVSYKNKKRKISSLGKTCVRLKRQSRRTYFIYCNQSDDLLY